MHGCITVPVRAPALTERLESLNVRLAFNVHLVLARTLWGDLMGIESIVIWLIVGAVAGWLAGMVVKGGGYGLLGNIVVGIIGAVIAGWLLPQLGVNVGSGFIAAIIDAFIGAVILLVILRLIGR